MSDKELSEMSVPFPEYAKRFAEKHGEPRCFEDAWFVVVAYKREVILYKQKEYGPKNISGRMFQGILTRKDDKIARLNKLYGLSQTPASVKGASDAWLDDGNYSDIALLLMAGIWGIPLSEDKK